MKDDGYSYDLFLNLEVLKDYSAEANVIYKFATRANHPHLNQFPYQTTYYFNENGDMGESLKAHIENTSFNIKLSRKQQNELWNTLMFLCYEIEVELLNILLSDQDHLKLIAIGNKIIKIQHKKLSGVTVNRISLDDEVIENKVIQHTCGLLAEKFVKRAVFTPFRELKTIEEIIEFTNNFKKVNETVELQVLGSGADMIQTYLHNEGLIISKDNTKLNLDNKSEFPLTNEQCEFIYFLFEIFKLLTPRKKTGFNANLYIRNCINNYKKVLNKPSSC